MDTFQGAVSIRYRGLSNRIHRCTDVSSEPYISIYHTCYISHCEIKSHRIWPFWKPIPIRFSNLTEFFDHLTFKSHRIFRPSNNMFYEEININHTLIVFITCFSYLNKDFWLFWGNSKVIIVKTSQSLIKSPLKIGLISQISVHSLWHVWHTHCLHWQ